MLIAFFVFLCDCDYGKVRCSLEQKRIRICGWMMRVILSATENRIPQVHTSVPRPQKRGVITRVTCCVFQRENYSRSFPRKENSSNVII